MTMDSNKNQPRAAALVIGASGAIGNALVNAYLSTTHYQVIAVSRQSTGMTHPRLHWFTTDHSEQSITSVAQELRDGDCNLERVAICTGTLHGDGYSPEKKIEQLRPDAMNRVFEVNVHVPTHWLRCLTPLLCQANAVVAVLSARVGSIGDNRAGGWYSYRSSKAALNMILKSMAVEYARRAPGIKLLAFHPGTTDSPLSKPFQKNVPEGKLFTPGFVADRLVQIMDEQHADGDLSFLDWQGLEVPW